MFPFQKSRSVPPFTDLLCLRHAHPLSLHTLEILNESPANSVSALIVAPPSADEFRRAHRHSIPGHRLNNYLKFLHELKSTTAQLFSTAVISGSSSAPNLQEMPCTTATLASGMPNIRPLETLHNSLSLRQLDAFLEYVTQTNFKTPCPTPPGLRSSKSSSDSSRKNPMLGQVSRDSNDDPTTLQMN